MVDGDQNKVGDKFYGVLLETFRDHGISRPRVRPIESLPRDWRVEFPRKLRDDHPLGTRFRADLKISQKTNKSDGSLRGDPYLVVDKQSIVLETDFKLNHIIYAIKFSDRYYEYLEEPSAKPQLTFSEIRAAAYQASRDEVAGTDAKTIARNRSEKIRQYALVRSHGHCEACDKPAPFIARNGKPYLEVHHITALGGGEGGTDSPDNVAAVCPNCHRRVDFGEDSKEFNDQIRARIVSKEADLGVV